MKESVREKGREGEKERGREEFKGGKQEEAERKGGRYDQEHHLLPTPHFPPQQVFCYMSSHHKWNGISPTPILVLFCTIHDAACQPCPLCNCPSATFNTVTTHSARCYPIWIATIAWSEHEHEEEKQPSPKRRQNITAYMYTDIIDRGTHQGCQFQRKMSCLCSRQDAYHLLNYLYPEITMYSHVCPKNETLMYVYSPISEHLPSQMAVVILMRSCTNEGRFLLENQVQIWHLGLWIEAELVRSDC